MIDPAFLSKIRRRERVSQWVIVGGGILIVVSVLAILLQIVSVALPLFYPPSSDRVAGPETLPIRADQVVALGMDDYLETGYVLHGDGEVRFFELDGGTELQRAALESPAETPGATIRSAFRHRSGDYSFVWTDGAYSRDRMIFRSSLSRENERRTELAVSRVLSVLPEEGSRPLRAIAVANEHDGYVLARSYDGGRFDLRQVYRRQTPDGTIETVDETFDLTEDASHPITQFVVSSSAEEAYAVTSAGNLVRWTWSLRDLDEPIPPTRRDDTQAVERGVEITALSFVFGDRSVVVGDERGGLTRWFPARSATSGGRRNLTRVQRLPSHTEAIRSIEPTERDKAILVTDERGIVHLDHTTSEKRLLSFGEGRSLRMASLNSRGNGLIGLHDDGGLSVWRLEHPHADVNTRTLFSKVWYEGYDEPVFHWESSSATQDSEPKMSLVPLVFGTIKGTLFAMLFALPIAVFAALYTSQFLHPRLRGVIKPIIEIMAAIPSVVIGFLAAQWFAPILQASMGGMLLALLLFPLSVIATVILWQRLGLEERARRFRHGYEFLFLVPAALVAFAISAALGHVAEQILFDGDMHIFLFETFDVVYDPRNCIVIAFALGFAVIPIIFTITEDSLSNVPRSLSAGSLALGASRWQTAWRVVLPAALPGIFAATMIGLGRAVGETMIVLMATGNTAVMDWSPFNGMRTISANIATEAAEAPYLGSLYRVLFLSAVILFVSTFVLNTVAEVVRAHLRRKYARF